MSATESIRIILARRAARVVPWSLVTNDDSTATNVMTANDSINGNWVYGYDDFNRLTSATVSANGGARLPASWTYVYDRFGNRWQQNVTSGSGPSSSLSFDANNHIIGSGITYDAAGNVTNDGTNTYTYNPEERIASVPSQSASFYYDGDGNRGVIYATACNVCQFPYWYRVYDLQDQEIARCSFTFGCGPNEYREGNRQLFNAGFDLFEHPDWLGTERYLTETNASQYGYCLSDPYGDGLYCPEIDGDTTNIHFVGKELDNANEESPDLLYNFGARYYAYWLARFMSPDPDNAGADPTVPQSWNMYSYVLNNPLSFTDPTGLWCVWEDGTHDDNQANGGASEQECSDQGGYGDPNNIITGMDANGNITGNLGAPPIKSDTYYNPPAALSILDIVYTPELFPKIRGQRQTFGACMESNSKAYSLGGAAATFADLGSAGQNILGGVAGNTFTDLYFEGPKLLDNGITIARAAIAGISSPLTFGRRTTKILSMNLAGKGGLPKALSSSSEGVGSALERAEKALNFGLTLPERLTIDASFVVGEAVACR